MFLDSVLVINIFIINPVQLMWLIYNSLLTITINAKNIWNSDRNLTLALLAFFFKGTMSSQPPRKGQPECPSTFFLFKTRSQRQQAPNFLKTASHLFFTLKMAAAKTLGAISLWWLIWSNRVDFGILNWKQSIEHWENLLL